ncbi:two-component sensor histidine kinase BarA [Vibrio breoganii]|uniref:two-component sensor histidine kinase BarA n=1 Tax=Vibrio breoganii TaxID=553239 RepID=UPI000C843A13|nr:two-component sensor histidine kinase BarA [Vibrio breoganii]PMG06227.1 two-component sensor histidine kinase BarA [Vibrio breoganii]
MTRYGLRARVITLTLAPTLIVGMLLSVFFTSNRYNDLEAQLITAGTNIVEPLAIASEFAMLQQNREAVRRLISYSHRKRSDVVRSIAVFDANHELFVTSNFHPNFQSLMFPQSEPIPLHSTVQLVDTKLIIRTPVIAEAQFVAPQADSKESNQVLGYIAIELDLSSLRLQQYQEIVVALVVMFLGVGLSAFFAYRLMQDITAPITHLKNSVDRIRRGQLDVRIEGKMHGELNSLKNGINAMAMSLSEYHIEMQHSIDQATSDLRETLEQLEIQNVELDIAKKRAQEAARVKSEFLANMSHELRTPLNGVIGFTRQMLKTNLSHSQTDYLLTIERSANNLLSIINDILDFSKLEAGKLLLENIPFDFQESLEEVVNLQAPSAHEKGLELTLKIDPKIPAGVVGDSLRIQQVLTNLVGNAVKFTERGNIDVSIELRTQKEDQVEIQFMVKDSGIGISERQQAQLFQAFSQADASISRRYGGTGLGLVITQKLVRQMGGEISLTSRLHQGSTFWFTIRLNTTDLPLEQIDLSDIRGKEVLLIEQNLQAANVLQQLLTQESIVTQYRSAIPESITPHDYIIYNVPVNEIMGEAELVEFIYQAKAVCPNVIIGLPSNQLALSETLMAQHSVTCIIKPLTRTKIMQAMLRGQDSSVPIYEKPEPLLLEKLPLKVMAVDDNPANLKLISALLDEHVESVTTCSNGQSAVDEATRTHFDLILMDIQMPGLDGVAACQAIKQTATNKDTPIIAVTAHAMSGERDRLLQAGMDDYLTKPIEERVLLKVLNHWGGNPIDEPVAVPAPEVVSAPSSDVIIDWRAALAQSANKEDLAKEMLQMLVDYIPEVNEIVEQAIDEQLGSREDLIHHIHKLHGSSSYCGVPKLKKACALLEQMLRSGETIEDIEPELLELQDEMEKVQTTARLYLQG